MRIKVRTTAVFGTILLVLMALVLAPTSLASCSTGVEENEVVVVEPTTTSTSTPTLTPTQIPEPTQTPTPTAIPTVRPRYISSLQDPVQPGTTKIVVGGASDYVVGSRFTLNFGTPTSETIQVIAVGFERRPNHGVHILTLNQALLFAHAIGESLYEARAETVPIPSSPTNVSFVFDPSTSDEDRELIINGIAFAHSFFSESLGHTVTDQIEVKTLQQGCLNGGQYVAYPGGLCITIGGDEWSSLNKNNKTKILAHEYYHILQISVGCIQWGEYFTYYNTPNWLTEGAAEFVASLVLSHSGGTPIEASRLSWSKNISVNPAEALSRYETQAIRLRYDLAAMAADQISGGSAQKLLTYCSLRANGQAWNQSAFQAFSITPTAFYEQFELYRANGYK